MSQWLSPDASLSTSGDYATDTFSDPWDFNNVEDMLPIEGVGVAVATSPRIEQGIFKANVQPGAELRLLMKWPHFIEPVLPWGRDGWAHPIDGARYTQTTFRIQSDQNLPMAVRYWRADGQGGQVNFSLPAGGWQTIHLNMLAPEPGSAPWAGPIVRFELFSAGAGSLQLDWVRLHRADVPQAPPANVPIPQVLTPNEQGGADYATVERGNPWDFAGMDDVGETHDVANLTTASGDLQGTSVANDPFIGLPLGPELNPDRYHRLTLDVCMDGGFNLTGNPGGGMVGRMAWIKDWTGIWSETQDFVVFPGCHTMTIDLATTPASRGARHVHGPPRRLARDPRDQPAFRSQRGSGTAQLHGAQRQAR